MMINSVVLSGSAISGEDRELQPVRPDLHLSFEHDLIDDNRNLGHGTGTKLDRNRTYPELAPHQLYQLGWSGYAKTGTTVVRNNGRQLFDEAGDCLLFHGARDERFKDACRHSGNFGFQLIADLGNVTRDPGGGLVEQIV